MATPLVAPPFGRDTSATNQIHYGRMVSDPAILLAEADYRRLTTKRGMLLDDPNYGLCLTDLLGADLDDSEIAAIAGRIEGELLKDERHGFLAVTVTPTRNDAGDVELDIDIDGRTSTGESFSLAIHVDDVTIQLLGIEGSNG